jgi:hypothetical protein
VSRRFALSALVLAAVLCELAGANGLAHLVLLAAVVAAALVVLDVVSERIAQQAGIPELVLAVGALATIVAGATVRAPLLALGAVAFAALEPLADELSRAAASGAKGQAANS